MARVFMCDHCGESAPIEGKGNQRPLGWSTVRITVRLRSARGGTDGGVSEPVNSELCPKCTPELASWLGKKL